MGVNIPKSPVIRPTYSYEPKDTTMVTLLLLLFLLGIILGSGIAGYFIGRKTMEKEFMDGTATAQKALEEKFLQDFGFTSKEEAKQDAMELLKIANELEQQ